MMLFLFNVQLRNKYDDDDDEKKRSERRKHCALAVVRRSQKFSPRRRPLPGGAGLPKFNQLEMVSTFYLQTQFVEDRCTQFRVIMATNSPPHTHTQTDRTDYNTLRR